MSDDISGHISMRTAEWDQPCSVGKRLRTGARTGAAVLRGGLGSPVTPRSLHDYLRMTELFDRIHGLDFAATRSVIGGETPPVFTAET